MNPISISTLITGKINIHFQSHEHCLINYSLNDASFIRTCFSSNKAGHKQEKCIIYTKLEVQCHEIRFREADSYSF